MKLTKLIDRLNEIRHMYVNRYGVEAEVWDFFEFKNGTYEITLSSRVYKDRKSGERTGEAPIAGYRVKIP